MKKSFTHLLIGIMIMFVAACSAVPDPTAIQQTPVMPSPTPTQTLPTLTQQKVPVLLPTGTPFPYSTFTPERPAPQQCLTIEDYIPGQTPIDGILLFYGTGSPYGRKSSYDLKQGGYRDSPLIPTYGRSVSDEFSVSPNGKWVAFLESTFDATGKTNGRYLQVADANGKKVDLPTWSFINSQKILGWINNEQVAIKIPGKPFGTIVALNPFSGQVDFIPPPDSPVVDNDSSFTDDFFYNQALTHVLFVKGSGWEEIKYALMDRSTQQVIWEGEFNYMIPPKWAPDGQSFTVFGPNPAVPQWDRTAEQLFQVTVEGQAIPLTTSQPTLYSEPWSWSPDGRFIAAWLVPKVYPRENHLDPRSLNLIDVAARSSIDYCLESENLSWVPDPVWSPNSQYIAIPMEYTREGAYGYQYYVWKTIIVDTKNNKAYKLMDDVIPVGWMAEP